MDDQRFDRIAKTLAGGLSRRRAVSLIGGGVAAGMAGLLGRRAAPAEAQQACDPQCEVLTFFGVCVPKLDWTPCDVHNRCRDSVCWNGTCVGGEPVSCRRVDPCHDPGTCNAATGRCDPGAISSGTCFIAGQCYGPGERSPENWCMVCNPAMSQTSFSLDPDACSINGWCYEAGDPDPANQCRVCDPAVSQTSFSPRADGTSCNADGNACTRDVCQGGFCRRGEPVVCSAPDACHTAGTCDPASGLCSEPTLTAGSCKSGRIKDGPCDCDGTCCDAGDNCVGQPGQRRCMPK